jgi:hypothetical protein
MSGIRQRTLRTSFPPLPPYSLCSCPWPWPVAGPNPRSPGGLRGSVVPAVPIRLAIPSLGVLDGHYEPKAVLGQRVARAVVVARDRLLSRPARGSNRPCARAAPLAAPTAYCTTHFEAWRESNLRRSRSAERRCGDGMPGAAAYISVAGVCGYIPGRPQIGLATSCAE